MVCSRRLLRSRKTMTPTTTTRANSPPITDKTITNVESVSALLRISVIGNVDIDTLLSFVAIVELVEVETVPVAVVVVANAVVVVVVVVDVVVANNVVVVVVVVTGRRPHTTHCAPPHDLLDGFTAAQSRS
jgi:hypothetical protein